MAADGMSRGWQSACHPRADHRRPSRRGWRHDRRHPLRVAWLLSASPNVRPTLCAESACEGALCHNVIGLVVLLRVPIVVDLVGPVKKGERKTSGRKKVQCVRHVWSRVRRTLYFFRRENRIIDVSVVTSRWRYLLDQLFLS